MKKELLPYLLPIVTLIGLVIFAFANPQITGFAVKELNDQVSAKVVIFTDSNVVVPKDSTVEVLLDDKLGVMSLENFIKKNGSWYELKNGGFPSINFYGEGYTGNHNYALDISEFNIGTVENKDVHTLKVRVMYNSKVISETVQEVAK